MKLCKTHSVGIFYNQRVCVGYVNTRFDNRRADKNIYFAFKKFSPHFAEFVFGHFSVTDSDICIGKHSLDFSGFLFNILNPVIEIVNLTATAEFLLHCLNKNGHIMLDNIGLNRLSVLGSFL